MIQRIISPKYLGLAIRDRRKQKGLSQIELGARVGMQQPTISKVENGKSGTELSTIFRLFSALDLDFMLQPRNSTISSENIQGDDW